MKNPLNDSRESRQADSSYYPQSPPVRRTRALNDTLNTEYVDVSPDDTSFHANMTRTMTSLVASCTTPRKILIILRILKALTFAFLLFTVIADLMYICFVELKASVEVQKKVGGTRDTIIRLYGLAMTVIALMIELDVPIITKYLSGLRAFIPRALLQFFIATITTSHPLHKDYMGQQNDDVYGYDDDRHYSDKQVSQEIPSSAVVFQMVTSLILGCCAAAYLTLGILCVDKLRSRAFMSDRDPVQATAIPTNSNIQTMDSYMATGSNLA